MEGVVSKVKTGEARLSAEVHALGVRNTHHHRAADELELDHGVHEVLYPVLN